MTPLPPIRAVRDADFGFGFWPWSKGPRWRLEADHTFALRIIQSHGEPVIYTIPAGYEFDKASVPPVLWGPPFNYTPDGVCTVPALEHDFLCDLLSGGSEWLRAKLGTLPWCPPASDIHHHFHIRLHEEGMRPSKAEAMGQAVKKFGPGGSLRPSTIWRRLRS